MGDQQSEKGIDSKQAASSFNPIISFNPAFPNIEDVKTAILLLQSKEESILLSTIEALSKYASKLKDNLKILFDLGILTDVLPIIKHDNLCIRRFAAKLLAEMIVRPEVSIYLIESNYVAHFAELLENETDTFMQEYFSAILAKLSTNPYGAALLVKHYPNVNLFFEMIKLTDPDIKKNNLEILNNLMQDLVGAHNISNIEELCFCLLYCHFESSFSEIQHLALDLVTDIIARNKNENVQSLFRKTKGIEVLLDFLKNNKKRELQIKALKILRFATENVVTVDEFINTENILQIFDYAKSTQNSNFFLEAFRIIVHVANTPNGRQILYSHTIVDEILYLIDELEQIRQSEIVEVICYGIGKMALYSPAAKIFANQKLIIIILDLMKNEDLQWSAKYAVIFALRQLLISDSRNYDIFFEMHGQDYLLLLINYFPKQISVEICTIALEILTIIARHVTFRNILVNFNIVNTISTLLKSTYPFSDELKVICCDLLSILCLEEDGKQQFFKANGVQHLYPLITDSHSISVRNAAIQLVQMISIDLTAAKTFVEHQYLLYMSNNRAMSRVIPSWETCIRTLFKSYLPMKFAFTGRLSENDITQDGFYALRRSVCPLPILDDIWKLKICPLEPIYVINCLQLSPTLNILKNKVPAETKLETKFEGLQCDPHFIEYVEQFKCILLTTELKDVCTDIPLVLSRAKTLAQFVARQMCGFYPEIECIDQQLEVHLKEIKEHLETSVIPIGQLRVGSYLERALLFKAIADRVCLPVALVRGEYGISWIEIAIPQLEGSNESLKILDDKVTQCSESACTIVSPKLNASTYDNEKEKTSLKTKKPKIPIKLIKPKFIIDLMERPGDLIPIGSHRAKLYCMKKLIYNKMYCH